MICSVSRNKYSKEAKEARKKIRGTMHDKVGWRVVSVYRLQLAIARSLAVVEPGPNGNVGQPQRCTIEDAR